MIAQHLAMTCRSAISILALMLAMVNVAQAESKQNRHYAEMPDEEFLNLFGGLEFCRNPMRYPDKYVDDLKKTVSEEKAQSVLMDQRIRCDSLGSNSASIAGFMGYEVSYEALHDPAFWNYIDQVRARNGVQ